MFELKDKEILRYGRELQKISSSKFPAAVRMALNAAAYATQLYARNKTIKNKMRVRTDYTLRGVVYTKATGGDINSMYSLVGAMERKDKNGNAKDNYLGVQEGGGDLSPNKKYHYIPTLQSRTSKDINRAVASRYRLDTIMNGGQMDKNFVVIKNKQGRKMLLQKMSKGGVKVLRNLTTRVLHLKARHWLKDAIATSEQMDRMFIEAAKKIIGGTI